MNIDKSSVKVLSVTRTDISSFAHESTGDTFIVTTYDVQYVVKGQRFSVPLQKSIKNGKIEPPYIFTAWIDRAMEVFYNKSIREMGKYKQSNRENLAKIILDQALQKLK